ncbi:MAG TPA: hypothetical protein VF683_02535, partial [Chthoniobacterales bacterium]
MAKQSLFWTALPNGYSPDRRWLRASLLVSPRLEPDFEPHLKAFPDFVDWPGTLAGAKITLRFGTRAATVGDDAQFDPALGLPDPAIWRALFPEPARTFVRGFVFRDLSSHAVLSYPVADLHEFVRDLYTRLASTAADDLPTASTILADSRWREFVDLLNRNDLNDSFTDYKRGVRRPENQFRAFKNHAFDKPALEHHLARFQLFHPPPSKPRIDRYEKPRDEAQQRAQWLGYERTALPRPNEFRDRIDFHQIVAAMNQYPTLLRKLGLVIDVLVPARAFGAAPDALFWAEVALPEGSPAVERLRDASPRTRALLDGARFQAVSRPGDFKITNGLLEMTPKTFSLVQADVDGAVMKMSNFARTLARMNNERPGVNPAQDNKLDAVTKQPRETGAPALRNAGLMLVHRNRAQMLKNNFTRQLDADKAAKNLQAGVSTTPPEMHAEDLVRGYRIDIWDDVSGRWHSLCRRAATYNLSEGTEVVAVPDEEGTVRLAATTSPDPASNRDLIWLHEAVVSWGGWSLTAPPPGRTIGHDAATHTDPVTDPEAQVPVGLPLRTEFHAVRGTLPRLRYGRR